MKYAVLGIVATFVVIAIIGCRSFRSPPKETGGFKDWGKNPDYRKAAAEYAAERDALKVPDEISPDEIQKMVDRLFLQKDEDFNLDRLKLVGEKAIPYLVQALERPQASKKFVDVDHVLAPKSPFERIAGLLEPFGHASAVRPLAQYIDHEDDHFRQYAALALGSTGTKECIAPLLKALDDTEVHVRCYAMSGIEYALRANRGTQDFRSAMFPALTRLLNRDSCHSGTAPKLLLVLDTARALPILLSPENFNIDNNEVRYILQALNEAGNQIPHETLLPFLERVKSLVEEYPHASNYAAALVAYAHNPDASAEQLFRAESKSQNATIQTAAAEALSILAGFMSSPEDIYDALAAREFDQLTEPQKHYWAVTWYDIEVNNGGHAQYFVNPAGDDWKWAMAGLTAMGATEQTRILHDATALFGTDGPPVDHDLRHEQLAQFNDHQFELLNELDESYDSCETTVEALLAQYALKNKDHFGATR